MPSLRDIKRRIRSVQKTQQITSAMRMVAAAKLRRAQDAILAARPYSDRMWHMLAEIGRRQPEATHPLLEEREEPRTLELVVVTSDRGLCGAFNANALKRAQAVLAERQKDFREVAITCVGRKGFDHFRRRHAGQIAGSWSDLGTVRYEHAQEVAGHLARRFTSGEADEVVLVYNEFVTALTQRPTARTVLPLRAEPEPAPETEARKAVESRPFEIEPDPQTLFDVLVPNAFEFVVYRALLENQAGEQAARMTAMESATRNTEELIDTLTLRYNRARQAAITKELVEIVSGAEAL